MQETTNIRKASADEAEKIGDTLASAFFGDPVFTWVSPDDERRRALLPPFFTLFAESMLPLDATYVAGENAGAALWAPPGWGAVAEESEEEFYCKVLARIHNKSKFYLALSSLSLGGGVNSDMIE